mmetsp:Transcript_15480/g.43337  ORF Transcript_15480/g.43337 Transcript_15480/m.43337 type:complete len:267 (-) Transcript_15480:42-842(-)
MSALRLFHSLQSHSSKTKASPLLIQACCMPASETSSVKRGVSATFPSHKRPASVRLVALGLTFAAGANALLHGRLGLRKRTIFGGGLDLGHRGVDRHRQVMHLPLGLGVGLRRWVLHGRRRLGLRFRGGARRRGRLASRCCHAGNRLAVGPVRLFLVGLRQRLLDLQLLVVDGVGLARYLVDQLAVRCLPLDRDGDERHAAGALRLLVADEGGLLHLPELLEVVLQVVLPELPDAPDEEARARRVLLCHRRRRRRRPRTPSPAAAR